MKKINAVFLDRDGVVLRGKIHNGKLYAINNIEKVFFYPKVKQSIDLLKKSFKVFIITNQPDIGNNKVTYEEVKKVNQLIINKLKIDKIYMCPHSKNIRCKCRKPNPYFILKAAKDYNIDLKKSYMVGDRGSDILSGYKAGCKSIFINRKYKESKPLLQIKTVYSLNEATRFILNR